jgi:hypothetical protein
MISGEQLTGWLIAMFLFGYMAYKEWPELRKRMTSGVLKQKSMEETDTTLIGKVEGLEKALKEVNEKLDRDYRRLNEFERWQREAQEMHAESAEERALMMKGMFACLDGLQQLGANGNTTQVKSELNDFMIKTSHKGGKE